MKIIYNIFIRLYVLGIHIAALWNDKARTWLEGRKTVLEDIANRLKPGDKTVWIHAASAGEFEQAKPVIEALKQQYPGYKILVTFFSPSGFNSARKYLYADMMTYMPADKQALAEQFVQIVNPKLVIFIKYDFWYHHLSAVAGRRIPLLLVSSIFRRDQIFFKPYGGFFKKMLFFFTHLFVQDKDSEQLLQEEGLHKVSISGDTRFDRVIKIISGHQPAPFIEAFIGDRPALIAGSTWPDDEALISDLQAAFPGLACIIAPHEINEAHIQSILKRFPGACRYSALSANTAPADFGICPALIIDNMGMLSRLYHYATVTYIGGGFNESGIHNTLEAAVYSKPVIFGTNYKKFKEARDLLACKGAFSVKDSEELKELITRLFSDKAALTTSGEAAGHYVASHTGATEIVMKYIASLITKESR